MFSLIIGLYLGSIRHSSASVKSNCFHVSYATLSVSNNVIDSINGNVFVLIRINKETYATYTWTIIFYFHRQFHSFTIS